MANRRRSKDGRDAVAKADQFKPDVAILDIMMPSLNGLDATKQIAKLSPRTKVLILTIHDSDQLIQQDPRRGCAWIYPQDRCEPRFNNGGEGADTNKTFFTALSGANGNERIFRKRAKGKRGRVVAINGKGTRNRAASGGRQERQGSGDGVGSQRQNGRHPPVERYAETGLSFGYRTRPLRGPESYC